MLLPEIYIENTQILSPLGNGTKANLEAISAGRSGIFVSEPAEFNNQKLQAALFSGEQWTAIEQSSGDSSFTAFESLLICSIQSALAGSSTDLRDPRTLLVIASTKGNIGLLKKGIANPQQLASLPESAKKIAAYLGYKHQPVVVSNACISGLTALITAKRLIAAGLYDQAVVAGADCISPFIVAGFRSFQALSEEVCRPFDLQRKGLNLGEGAATIILTRKPSGILFAGGASSSDANHISGPSRTGEEMAQAIQQSLTQAGLVADQIGAISAHGTATPFNDEMESKAFSISGMQSVPVFSLKAYFGHTLGAAGLLESAISIAGLRLGIIPKSAGYAEHGVTVPVQINKEWKTVPDLRHLLKTGSGFGGCNAAVIFSKID